MLVNEKNTAQIFASFYILEGRLYSQEQMADWRLQFGKIYQEIYSGMLIILQIQKEMF